MHLLFVCTGNTCRSPLAEAAWRRFGDKNITASSAGLAASNGAPVSPHSAQVAQGWNEDLANHKARRITEALVHQADYLVAMTAAHAGELRTRFPQSKVLVLGDFVLSEDEPNSVTTELQELFGEAPGDILDPIGGSLEAYQACGEHIARAVKGLAAALREERV
jgi:protein-tyrosine phosphatase